MSQVITPGESLKHVETDAEQDATGDAAIEVGQFDATSAD